MFELFKLDLIIITGLITSITAISDSSLSLSWFNSPEFAILQKVYDDCLDKNDFTGCLKNKAVVAITKAIDQDNVKIVDGLYFQRQNETEKESIMELSGARTLNSLSPIDRGLFEKLDKFLRTHVIRVDMSEGRDGGGGGDSKYGGGYGGGGGGGGGKKKKGGGNEIIKYIIAAIMTAAGIAGPLALKVLAVIAGKALIISKVALTIAGIIALKKLFSHDHHEESSYQVHAAEHTRRNSYPVRQIKVTPTSADPYRYYYDYQQHQ